jgi:hypothetical protein
MVPSLTIHSRENMLIDTFVVFDSNSLAIAVLHPSSGVLPAGSHSYRICRVPGKFAVIGKTRKEIKDVEWAEAWKKHGGVV